MSELDGMRAFWDQKAHDNPLWFVTTTLDYHAPDEHEFWRTGEGEVARVLADASCAGGDVAVEIGCGVGRLTRALALRFRQVYAYDVSPNMVEHARRNLRDVPGIHASPTSGDGSIPRPDASADFVLSMQVFHHIPDRAITLRYIREAGRVLKPGGRLGFQLRTCRSRGPVADHLERALRDARSAWRRKTNPPPAALDASAWHGSRVLLSEIRRAGAAHGLRIDSVRWLDVRGGNAQIICTKGTSK